MARVCIDAGHGGRDPGAIGREPFELEERAFNLAVTRGLEAALRELGHHPLVTRRTDRTLSLAARAAFANRHRADLFVSVHANAAGTPAAEGMEVFCFPGSSRGRPLAESVLVAMLDAFPDHRDRGVKSANFAVLRLTAMPAVLVECEFLTNPSQLAFLADPEVQCRLAEAIAFGVDRRLAEDGPPVVASTSRP